MTIGVAMTNATGRTYKKYLVCTECESVSAGQRIDLFTYQCREVENLSVYHAHCVYGLFFAIVARFSLLPSIWVWLLSPPFKPSSLSSLRKACVGRIQTSCAGLMPEPCSIRGNLFKWYVDGGIVVRHVAFVVGGKRLEAFAGEAFAMCALLEDGHRKKRKSSWIKRAFHVKGELAA